jgi:GGDEF domain-containing protein
LSSIFLSHSKADKPFVRRLSKDLKYFGIRVWVDEAEIQIGDSLIEKIREGIDNVKFVGVILSKTSVRSEWVKKEVDVAMNQEIEGKKVKVLPLLIESCDLPGFLKGKLYADFQIEDSYQKELFKLVKRLGINPVDKMTFGGNWQDHNGRLLSLAQYCENVMGEYEKSGEWGGDIFGKIVENRLIFHWKKRLRQGVGYLDIENETLCGAYWFQAFAPDYLSLLANPDKISESIVTEHNKCIFMRVGSKADRKDLSYRSKIGDTYSIVVFTLTNLDTIISSLGHDATQEVIHSMGVYIDKHFGAIGGFSTRRKSNEFLTVLPYSNLAEAESILKDFVKDFQEQGISDIWAEAQKQAPSGKCIDFTILAGIAQGQPTAEIDSVIDSARSQQKEIARIQY